MGTLGVYFGAAQRPKSSERDMANTLIYSEYSSRKSSEYLNSKMKVNTVLKR